VATVSTVAVLQARTGSTRLPGKVLLPLAGAPALLRMIERLASTTTVDRLVVATTLAPGDDAVVALCDAAGVAVVRGSEDDVLSRVVLAVEQVAPAAELVVRLTGDCPLIDPGIVDAVVLRAADDGLDYVSNTQPPTWPDGLDVEVVRRQVLVRAHRDATLPSDREHVTPWVRRSLARDRIGAVTGPRDLSSLRWTLDEPEDYVLVAAVYAALHRDDATFTTEEVLTYLSTRPEIARVNVRFARNEGYRASLEAERSTPHTQDPQPEGLSP
jgi:spore coat polysaccharide biosynthesis protein SpsF